MKEQMSVGPSPSGFRCQDHRRVFLLHPDYTSAQFELDKRVWWIQAHALRYRCRPWRSESSKTQCSAPTRAGGYSLRRDGAPSRPKFASRAVLRGQRQWKLEDDEDVYPAKPNLNFYRAYDLRRTLATRLGDLGVFDVHCPCPQDRNASTGSTCAARKAG
jgi:hypothetical protein